LLVFPKLRQHLGGLTLRLEQLVEKLRVIVLSSAPLEEIPSKIDQLFDVWRRIEHGAIDASSDSAEGAQIMSQLAGVDLASMRIMWEPLSDGIGDTITPNGWAVRATLYLSRGAPHWFIVASRAPDIGCQPTPEDDAVLERIIGGLGGDPQRDLMRDTRLLETGWARYFTWAHNGPLLEMHRKTKGQDFYLAEESAIPKPGYAREPRLTWKAIEQMRLKN
jgi:hypothetical protein